MKPLKVLQLQFLFYIILEVTIKRIFIYKTEQSKCTEIFKPGIEQGKIL